MLINVAFPKSWHTIWDFMVCFWLTWNFKFWWTKYLKIILICYYTFSKSHRFELSKHPDVWLSELCQQHTATISVEIKQCLNVKCSCPACHWQLSPAVSHAPCWCVLCLNLHWPGGQHGPCNVCNNGFSQTFPTFSPFQWPALISCKH